MAELDLPTTPPLNSTTDEKEQIKNHLIDNGRKVLEIHYNHYNRIDQKAQRFLAFVGAVEGYFIINFFLNRKFDAIDKGSIIMMIALGIGAIILGLYINILQSKPFYNGPNISEQANDFRPDGKIEDLKKDTLATLKISYEENIKTINKKAKLFKISIRGICLYFIALILYFAELKMNESQIPSDILGTQNIIINENSNDNPEDALITDNVGALDESLKDIQEIEQENNDKEQEDKEQEKSEELPTPPQNENEEELTSDNVGISESEQQQPAE